MMTSGNTPALTGQRANDLAARMDAALDGGGIFGALASIFGLMEIADEEIARAGKRHPEHADTLWHSFSLLTPTGEMGNVAEFVYRGHVRELLGRVVAGKDTRPGTAAEVVLLCSKMSEIAPFTDAAAGLYGRMWQAAGFPGDQFTDRQAHHEALDAPQIDTLERDTRRKLALSDRKLGALECSGQHHGRAVACKYAKPVQLALTA